MIKSRVEWALEYAMAGYAVFPCHWSPRVGECSCESQRCSSVGKHPLLSKGQDAATTDEVSIRKWWGKWPDANIALATNKKSGIFVLDIDVHDDKDGFLWYDAFESMFESSPTVRTASGGLHVYMKYPSGVTVRQSSDSIYRGVDIRSNGYVLVPPCSHKSGNEHYWEDSILDWDGDIPDAPDFLLEQISATNDVSPYHRQQKWRLELPVDNKRGGELREALEVIPADSRDIWLQVGMSIHSEHAGEDGYNIWTEWSSKSDKFNEKDQRYSWDRFDSGGGVSLATVFFLAMEHGYVPAKGFIESIDTQRELSERVTDAERYVCPDIEETPTHLFDNCGGVMQEIVDWINKTAMRRSPLMAVASALTFLGTVYGRRYQSPTLLRTNSYVISVAGTGFGKEHGRKCIKRLLSACGNDHMLGGERVKSDAGIIDSMQSSPVKVFLVDEIGHVLARIAKSQAGYEKAIIDVFMQLHSSANGVFLGANLASREQTIINQPHACLYGTSTEIIFNSLTAEDVMSGFLNRFVIMIEDGKRERKQDLSNLTPSDFSPPDSIIDKIKLNIEKTTTIGSFIDDVDPELATVTFSDDAHSVMLSAEDIAEEMLDGEFADIWARFEEHIIRFAMIRCISRTQHTLSSVPLEISGDDVRWAKAIVQWSFNKLEAKCAKKMSENAIEGIHKQVLDIIRDETSSSGVGISQRDLTRRTQFLHLSQRKGILSSLVDSENIVVTKDGRKTIYVAIKG